MKSTISQKKIFEYLNESRRSESYAKFMTHYRGTPDTSQDKSSLIWDLGDGKLRLAVNKAGHSSLSFQSWPGFKEKYDKFLVETKYCGPKSNWIYQNWFEKVNSPKKLNEWASNFGFSNFGTFKVFLTMSHVVRNTLNENLRNFIFDEMPLDILLETAITIDPTILNQIWDLQVLFEKHKKIRGLEKLEESVCTSKIINFYELLDFVQEFNVSTTKIIAESVGFSESRAVFIDLFENNTLDDFENMINHKVIQNKLRQMIQLGGQIDKFEVPERTMMNLVRNIKDQSIRQSFMKWISADAVSDSDPEQFPQSTEDGYLFLGQHLPPMVVGAWPGRNKAFGKEDPGSLQYQTALVNHLLPFVKNFAMTDRPIADKERLEEVLNEESKEWGSYVHKQTSKSDNKAVIPAKKIPASKKHYYWHDLALGMGEKSPVDKSSDNTGSEMGDASVGDSGNAASGDGGGGE